MAYGYRGKWRGGGLLEVGARVVTLTPPLEFVVGRGNALCLPVVQIVCVASGPAAILLLAPRQHQCRRQPRQIGQVYAGVGPTPPAARVLPDADLVRTLLVKPGQMCSESFDGREARFSPLGEKW